MSKIKKLGLSIVCFDGSEHIKNIIYEIRSLCDVIHVCLQKVSYHGDPIDQEDVDEVQHLKDIGYVDDIIWFNPDLSYKKQKNFDPAIPRKIECKKRNMMLDKLEEAGCSHSIIIDSDEFYDLEDFKRAYDIIDSDESIHITYCQYVNYYNAYDRLLIYPFKAYVPFIAESKYRFEFNSQDFNGASDPTRRYKLGMAGDQKETYAVFNWETVHMHHFSWIRKSVEKKIDNWSAKKYFDNRPYLRGRIIDRYNNWHEGLNAYLMFNVPNEQVIVQKLSHAYVHPRYWLNETAQAGVVRKLEEQS